MVRLFVQRKWSIGCKKMVAGSWFFFSWLAVETQAGFLLVNHKFIPSELIGSCKVMVIKIPPNWKFLWKILRWEKQDSFKNVCPEIVKIPIKSCSLNYHFLMGGCGNKTAFLLLKKVLKYLLNTHKKQRNKVARFFFFCFKSNASCLFHGNNSYKEHNGIIW